MKRIKNLFIIIALIIYLPLTINNGCEDTSIYQIIPYSGNWKLIFTYTDGTEFGRSVFTVQDTGGFCGKLTVTESGDEFYVKGSVTYDGQITGGFTDNCGSPAFGKFTGSFTELMGAFYASGNFSDTLRNPVYKGKWQARRTAN